MMASTLAYVSPAGKSCLPPAGDLSLEGGRICVTALDVADEPLGFCLGRQEVAERDCEIVDRKLLGRQDYVVDQGVGIPTAQHPLIDSRVDGRIVRHRSRVDAGIRRGRLEPAGNAREVTPEVTQHVRRRVLTLARMERARGPALALGLEEE